ncbi:TLDc domain-containing protein [Entamoeba marina]
MKRPLISQHCQLVTQELKLLTEWSGLNNSTIIFDTDLQGNGYGTLWRSVLNKKNLYFISFDNDNNVFGGYMNEIIKKTPFGITDDHSFIFSIMRNKEMKNVKYNIKRNRKHVNNAFSLHADDSFGYLYGFGYDILIYPIGGGNSYFKCDCYDYKGDVNALVDILYPLRFEIQRIVVVEMC